MDTFTGNVYWVDFLEKCCTKTSEACICLLSERFFLVLIFEYWSLVVSFDGIKCFSIFRSPHKWYFFLVSFSKLSPSSPTLGEYLFKYIGHTQETLEVFDMCWLWHFVNSLNLFIFCFVTIRYENDSKETSMFSFIL